MVAVINATEPTEISKLRVIITKANPDARINVDTAACIMFMRLPILRKLGVPTDRPIKTAAITVTKPYDRIKLCTGLGF